MDSASRGLAKKQGSARFCVNLPKTKRSYKGGCLTDSTYEVMHQFGRQSRTILYAKFEQ